MVTFKTPAQILSKLCDLIKGDINDTVASVEMSIQAGIINGIQNRTIVTIKHEFAKEISKALEDAGYIVEPLKVCYKPNQDPEHNYDDYIISWKTPRDDRS